MLPEEVDIPGTLTFQVEKCVDPVGVVVTVVTTEEVLTQRFTRNGQFPLIGERALSVEMSRNGTVLDLEVSVEITNFAMCL